MQQGELRVHEDVVLGREALRVGEEGVVAAELHRLHDGRDGVLVGEVLEVRQVDDDDPCDVFLAAAQEGHVVPHLQRHEYVCRRTRVRV